jgi:hypothetical protein
MVSSSRLFSFVWMAGLALAPLSRAAIKAQPNVVIITVDTLRVDHRGCYGYNQIRTPNIDALAADCVRFERAYTPVPSRNPRVRRRMSNVSRCNFSDSMSRPSCTGSKQDCP